MSRLPLPVRLLLACALCLGLVVGVVELVRLLARG